MSMICALSNETPEIPVVSPISGAVFERRLIEKYIKENGTDPINGEELREDQLIELKVPNIVKPKAPAFTSIPAILKSLQDEWDAVMLNSFTVRKQLTVARQELSHSLYQYDAACRVIARLNNELKEARDALATLKPQHDLNNHQQNGFKNKINEIDDPEFRKRLESKADQLIAERKKRGKVLPEDLTTADQIRQFKTVNSFSGLHSASSPGILALDVSPVDDHILITGGNDKNAIVFNKETEQIIATLQGHTKKVSSVILHPNSATAITASSDSTIRVWNIMTSQTELTLKPHDGPITAISLHPLNDFILSASTNELWAFSDLTTGKRLLELGDTSTEHALTTAQFHPDGMILGCGTSVCDTYVCRPGCNSNNCGDQDCGSRVSQIKIWDLRDKSNVATFKPNHKTAIAALKFSENGYHLATADSKTVKLWDLRKLREFKTITFENNYNVNEISFDFTGHYMAIAGNDIHLYETRKWEELRVFTDHTSSVTDVKFGKNASFIASTGLDRALKIYQYESN